ncbi:hypothetical protein V8C86DRAFT_2736592 [Haematococcus lacustris]
MPNGQHAVAPSAATSSGPSAGLSPRPSPAPAPQEQAGQQPCQKTKQYSPPHSVTQAGNQSVTQHMQQEGPNPLHAPHPLSAHPMPKSAGPGPFHCGSSLPQGKQTPLHAAPHTQLQPPCPPCCQPASGPPLPCGLAGERVCVHVACAWRHLPTQGRLWLSVSFSDSRGLLQQSRAVCLLPPPSDPGHEGQHRATVVAGSRTQDLAVQQQQQQERQQEQSQPQQPPQPQSPAVALDSSVTPPAHHQSDPGARTGIPSLQPAAPLLTLTCCQPLSWDEQAAWQQQLEPSRLGQNWAGACLAATKALPDAHQLSCTGVAQEPTRQPVQPVVVMLPTQAANWPAAYESSSGRRPAALQLHSHPDLLLQPPPPASTAQQVAAVAGGAKGLHTSSSSSSNSGTAPGALPSSVWGGVGYPCCCCCYQTAMRQLDDLGQLQQAQSRLALGPAQQAAPWGLAPQAMQQLQGQGWGRGRSEPELPAVPVHCHAALTLLRLCLAADSLCCCA